MFFDLLRVCIGSEMVECGLEETIVLALLHTNSLGISFGTADTCRSLRVLGTGVMHAIPLSKEVTPRVGEVTIVSRCSCEATLQEQGVEKDP